MKKLFTLSRLTTTAVIVLGAFAVKVASAASNDTWAGNTSPNWNTAANWDVNVVPAAGDGLFFGTAGSAGAGLNNDIAAGRSFAGITFNSGASPFTLGGNGIALIGGITNSSASPQLIKLAVTDSAGVYVNEAGGGTTLNGVFSGSGGLTNVGSGTVTLNSSNNSFTGGVVVNNGVLQVSGSGGNSSLGKGNATVNAGATLVGTNGDAFGYFTSSARNNPTNILINGGTVTTLAGAGGPGGPGYRITLPYLTFTGGLLTNDPANAGTSGAQWVLNGNNTVSLINGLAAGTTATIAANVAIQRDPVTFNIAAGSVPGGVNMLFSGVLSGSGKRLIKTGAGTLVFSSASTYSGATTISNGVFGLIGSASIASSTIGINDGAKFDVSQLSGPFTLAASKTLGGSGVVTGSVEAAGSSTLDAGLYGGHTLSFSNDLTLDGITVKFVLSGAPNGANSKIAVAGNLTLNAQNTISISGFTTLQNGTYPLFTYASETSNGQTWNLAGFASSGRQMANIVDTGTGEIDLVISGSVGNLKWVGDGAVNNWDVTTSFDWSNGTSADQFFNGDVVTFDDSGSTNPAVNLVGTLQPGAILVTNNTRDYTFSGTGLISGLTSLIKQGAGTLLLQENGGDTFSGGIGVSNGTVILDNQFASITGGLTINNGATAQIGNNDTIGTLPTGTLIDNGTLAFNRSDTGLPPVTAAISGTGGVTQAGSGSTTLSGPNTFSGNIAVSNGTLIDNNRAAGDGSVGGLGSSLLPGRTVSVGPGATLSGQVQNWFGAGTGFPDANSPAITIDAGTVISARYTSIGNITLNNGATLTSSGSSESQPNLYQAFQFRGDISVGGSSASTISTTSGKDNHLNSNTVFNVAVTSGSGPDLTVSTGLRNQSGDYSTAPGGLTKTGAGTMLLEAANSYTGNTTVSNGVLALNDSGSIPNTANIFVAGGARIDLSARTDGALTLAGGQTLSGSGTVLGNVTASAGATLAPGSSSSIGALTITNAVSLLGTNLVKINATAGTADQISGAQSIAYGGTLIVTNIGGTLAPNQTFKLFNAASYSGAFDSVVTRPALALGWSWNTNNLTVDGTISAVMTIIPRPYITGIRVNGSTLSITATNGAAGGQCVLLQSTNVALPLNQWTPVLTNAFDGMGNLNLSTNVLNPAAPQEFFILE
jgi:fibronectin-binding autotransporter adhesin